MFLLKNGFARTLPSSLVSLVLYPGPGIGSFLIQPGFKSGTHSVSHTDTTFLTSILSTRCYVPGTDAGKRNKTKNIEDKSWLNKRNTYQAGELSENSLISEIFVSTSEKIKQGFLLNAYAFRDFFIF
jgi:hypothetical protein